MGAWSCYEQLSGSDGALRLALQLCNAAGNDYHSWPEDVQKYSRLRPDYDGSGVLCTLQGVIDTGPVVVVCQALPETYERICEVIDSTTAEQWSNPASFTGYIQFINMPGGPDCHASGLTRFRSATLPV
jgi:hypothetical protein